MLQTNCRATLFSTTTLLGWSVFCFPLTWQFCGYIQTDVILILKQKTIVEHYLKWVVSIIHHAWWAVNKKANVLCNFLPTVHSSKEPWDQQAYIFQYTFWFKSIWTFGLLSRRSTIVYRGQLYTTDLYLVGKSFRKKWLQQNGKSLLYLSELLRSHIVMRSPASAVRKSLVYSEKFCRWKEH